MYLGTKLLFSLSFNVASLLFKKNVIFWLCWVFTVAWAFLWLERAQAPLQLCPVGLSLQGLLLMPSSDSRARGLQQLQPEGSGLRAPRLHSTDSGVGACRLSCFRASGIFWDQAWKRSLQHWQADILPLSHQRGPYHSLFLSNLFLNTNQQVQTLTLRMIQASIIL